MKYTLLSLFFLMLFGVASGQKSSEQLPVFPNCENRNPKELEDCFYAQLQDFVFNNFKVPENLTQNDYKGNVNVLFEVDSTGTFKVQYVDAIYPELIKESKRIFAALPKIKPATFNGKPVYSKFTYRIAIPLRNVAATQDAQQRTEQQAQTSKQKELTEIDSLPYRKFDNPLLKSRLFVPFTHSNYARFDAAMNQVGANNHTGSKPFTYEEVTAYYDLAAAEKKLLKGKTGWWGRKIWDENFVQFQGEGYWLTLNPIVDLRLGKSKGEQSVSTFQNTRGVQLQVGLGTDLVFTSTIYESQGRFAGYFNQYAESIKPSGGDPAIIPGVGIAKRFKADAYDFPSAEANITYTPSKFIDLQLGYGRNFIGDGYRSLLLGDAASPYPYIKINTKFWKIKYTNTYLWLKDVRQDVLEDRTYATKFMANHYLSWNINKRINLGFFESVVWTNSNGRGFDMNFVNPIIFYRTVEFTSSARSGNAVLGLTGKYKWSNSINFYGQFILDEFSLGAVKEQNKSWLNKSGIQLGAKYFNAFSIDNLLLQFEYNAIRPYVYSHSDPLTNYGHNNQSMGHPWGGNARELIAIARYNKGRYFADAKLTYGIRGFDFDSAADAFNYGGNIYKNYNEGRPFDTGVAIGQGNKTNIVIADLQAGYIINPVTNLKLFASLIYRSFDPETETATTFKDNTTWFSVGVRADLFNWYFDY
ncbi:gliding motility protein RemB [Flavobacterium magnum]|uniref:Gliding motility protein RemB n=1 Tax=Flavobacterium magnum TaxID=2162713 RepID=A0A2S0RE18_9FLAO|nr:gliding motility protein RemB [Flavobacterium magnum]